MKTGKSSKTYLDPKTNKFVQFSYPDALILYMYSYYCGGTSLVSMSNHQHRRYIFATLLPRNEQYIETVDSNGQHWYDGNLPIKTIHERFQQHLNKLYDKKYIKPVFPKNVAFTNHGAEIFDINCPSTHWYLTAKGVKRGEKLFKLKNPHTDDPNTFRSGWPIQNYLNQDDLNALAEYMSHRPKVSKKSRF
jgi:hypothetical protein